MLRPWRECCIAVRMTLFKVELNLPKIEVGAVQKDISLFASTQDFYGSKHREVILRPKTRQVAPGQIKPYAVWH
jgi:hypothetical protein